ncbi:PQQ-dependent sugar dehydrogenase [Haloarcula litorea]|uniref:PQQ-dependent sugar dehydrogenase n=1 Tax=Haloarcula litorea TaxID=3032579 RepID=UPI0023E7BB50|nr:PQQ-dependent sugar dehydrogenase [Halomicroarcula sp. GDY20]
MDTPTRRRFLRAGGLGLAALAGCGRQGDGQDGSTETVTGTEDPGLAALELGAETVATGFTSPVNVVTTGPSTHYVVDQIGVVSAVRDGERTAALDLRDRMVDVGGYDERGLLGMAVHPAFDGGGRVYLRYSAPLRDGMPDGYSHTFVLSEFRLADGTVDPASERVLLEIPQPQSNHNAGSVAFGPDGYLYVGVGDGGGANDRGRGHVADWYDAVAGGNGQDVTENLLGSILRIDVDREGDGGRPYGVPADNPLVGTEGLPEQYAWGLRNPWRFSFGPDGDFFVADVGQSRYEEVNVVEAGGNYGWNVREGTACFGADSCPSETPDGTELSGPIVQYPHSGGPVSGVSVIGGYRYAGSDLPELQMRYVFADWRAEGDLFIATDSGAEQWPVTTVPVSGEDVGPMVLSFGETGEGELLVCTTERGRVSGSTGAVNRLRPA